MKKSPLTGTFNHRHLQRTHILNAFAHHLPKQLGSFTRINNSYTKNRLVYHSTTHNADLIWRRRSSIGQYAKQHQKQRNQQLALFTKPAQQFRADLPTQIAFIWDLPPLDDNHEPLEPFPLGIKIAQPGYKLDENHWTASFPLIEHSETYPTIAELDPNELDWDIETDDHAQHS
ncbi:hypothetical protein G7Y31_06895 [Corynebacterium lizhenjunii]|uniref:Uncharacterized protein n=1 Tax=Corynebacterium lizhenjunii TaxID=2709394 RepID=A0A7T0KDD8_9CORY|nr:hypothetical protein [Corynebacterium lizhenjunii]QPK78311.1 hypothetical protein G7Y31_06895 [Corynebacterium lizhenjunii]